MVKKALKVLNKIELLVIYITFGGMIFAAFAQVIFRLILKSPLAWSEEACRYCFVWLVFLGGGWAVSGDAHFRVDFMIALFPKTERIFTFISHVGMLAFGGVILAYGISMLSIAAKQVSPALHISLAIPYAALPVSGMLIIIHELEKFYDMFRKSATNNI